MANLPEGVHDTFAVPCLDCGGVKHVEAGTEQPHDCDPPATQQALVNRAFWAGYHLALDERVPQLRGEVSR